MRLSLANVGSLLVALTVLLAAAPSHAEPKSQGGKGHLHHDELAKRGKGHHKHKDAPAVPELGAAGAGSAFALMLGVGLILADRRRRTPSISAR